MFAKSLVVLVLLSVVCAQMEPMQAEAEGVSLLERRSSLKPARILKAKKGYAPVIPPLPQLAVPMAELLNRANAQVANPNEKPDELDIALAAVKESIVQKTKQMAVERRWVKKVNKVVAELASKIKKVNDNVQVLRVDTRTLLKKKRQIENAKLQKRLERQLKNAKKDKDNLANAIHTVKAKAKDFKKNSAAIQKTIADIKGQLAKLRGQKAAAKKASKKARKAAKKAKKAAKKAKKAAKKAARKPTKKNVRKAKKAAKKARKLAKKAAAKAKKAKKAAAKAKKTAKSVKKAKKAAEGKSLLEVEDADLLQ